MNKGLIAAVLCGLLSACGGGGGGGGTGSMSLSLTDAPVTDAEEVVISFVGVELRKQGGETIEFPFSQPRAIDLLDFQGTNSTFLIEDESVPAGIYDQVRLIVEGENSSSCPNTGDHPSYIKFKNDPFHYPLVVPSGATSGLKINSQFTVAAGGKGDYTIDFDARKSIAERSNSTCYNLRPVLRVVDNAQVGTLTGSVNPATFTPEAAPSCNQIDTSALPSGEAVPGMAVYVFENPDGVPVTPDDIDNNPANPVTTASVFKAGDGSLGYTVGFLLAGTYTVALTCDAALDQPATDADPASGDNADVVFDYPQQVTMTTAGAGVDFPPISSP